MVVAPTAASAESLRGEVIAARGRGRADGSIVTDAQLRLADGSVRTVTQLGGHADGKTMVVFHGPPVLAAGMQVRVDAHPARRPGRWWLDDAVVLDAAGSRPYVRTTASKSGVPLYWAQGCVQIWWATEGTTAIAGEDEREAIARTIETWNQGTAACSYLNLVDMGEADREVGTDGVNLIKFRDESWCRPAVGDDDPICHAANAAGLTTVVYIDDPDHPRDGEIVDADVELNGLDFAISINGQTESGSACQADLENTLTHELGHLLGLDHTCLKPDEDPRTDGNGDPSPLCAATTDPVIRDATMYPEQNCGETKKASLTDDDIDGICAAYPIDDDPGTCGPPEDLDTGCCGTAPASAPLLPAALTGLLLARRPRRFARRRR